MNQANPAICYPYFGVKDINHKRQQISLGLMKESIHPATINTSALLESAHVHKCSVEQDMALEFLKPAKLLIIRLWSQIRQQYRQHNKTVPCTDGDQH